MKMANKCEDACKSTRTEAVDLRVTLFVKLGVVSFNTLIEHSHFPLDFRSQMNTFGDNLLQDR